MVTAGDIIRQMREENVSLTDARAREITNDALNANAGNITTKAQTRNSSSSSSSASNYKYYLDAANPLNLALSQPTKAESRTNILNQIGAGIKNTASFLSDSYSKIDNTWIMKGTLPFGVTPTEYKTNAATTKAQQLKALDAAKTELDYSKQSWYENLFGSGFMYPQAEKDYQAVQSYVIDRQLLTNQATDAGITADAIPTTDNNKNLWSYAALGIAAIALIMGLKK